MAQSVQRLTGLLRGLLGAAPPSPCTWAPEALAACSRGLHGAPSTQHVQPAPAEEAPDIHVEPRWLRELGAVRTDWTRDEVAQVFNTPLLDLVYHAAAVHRMHNDPSMVQRCTLLSIKTGGCPENCGYCSQSSHWSKDTGTKATKLLELEEVYEAALRAKASGSTRFCMGAAWRGPSQVGKGQWARVLDMVGRIRALDMEVCTTLGMLTPEQAAELRTAGLTAYNHNLDTSPEYYEKVTTTRKYEDRLQTIENVRQAGISVCAGGIIGLGEGSMDRVGLLHQLATLPAHPESVPINALVAIKGTPMESNDTPQGVDIARCVATARVVMPRTVVRLSAGRLGLSLGDQALCFLAGANSIFDGDKLLTTPNNDRGEDEIMFNALGLRSRPAFMSYPSGNDSSRDFEAGSAAERAQGAGGCGGQGHGHGEGHGHGHGHAHVEGSGCCGGSHKHAAA